MVTCNFDLLELADGESGEAAISVVVGKKKTEAAAAKLADAADPVEPAAHGKPKYSYFTKLQPDNGVRKCQQELKRLREVLIKLREEETKLKEKQGNEGRIKELSEEQRRLRQEQRKLRIEEAILVPQRKAFYEEHSIPLEEDERKKLNNSDLTNADSGNNYDGVNGNVYNNSDGGNCEDNGQVCDGGEHYSYGHDERQVERVQDKYINDERQGNRQGQTRMKKVYVRKVKASSDAGTEAEEKPEENVVSASLTDQKEANADNGDAVPASESEKSAGGATKDGPHNGQGTGTGERMFFQKERLNGSEKRKKKNAKKSSGSETEKAKKQDFEVDGLKKQIEKQPLEEEKKTLAEYERMREETKKFSEALKTEVRKVTAEEFKGLQLLAKKKLDHEEAIMKAEKAQPKVKEASKKEETVEAEGKETTAKDAKPKKVTVPRQNLGFRPPRRVSYDQEDGSSVRGRFNGSFQGGSRDNSTQNEAAVQNGNGASRGVYNGRGDGAPRGDYSGRRDNYNMGNGGSSYSRGNNNSGYQGNGGYQQQQHVGRYQQEHAGNGGYYRQQQRRASNDRYYRERRNSAPALDFEDVSKFPALSVPTSARSAAPGPPAQLRPLLRLRPNSSD
ncbi:uncharacterized protein C2845_PM13G12740 [Panicum miliaceum]|uniref:Uncharacterized protein n=1 Tax=Panicum miliaceum TaxID=4540 RepID=A0A3L6RKV3_PANMI|nr:uncharacterized protein C2845_PM13G12740 [Panicum miliaceum]